MNASRWLSSMRAASILFVLLAATQPGVAAEAVDTAADAQLEQRVQRIAAELRCLVCQNQTIADSNAPLAVDLRNQVREQLRAGRSEAQISAYMTERYGDFVLYRPPLKATTIVLWAGPFVALLVAAAMLARRLRRHGASVRGTASLDAALEQQARALLEGDRR
jgi:cytochrome c-type biogenesis protein CcmH/NrfF